MSGFFLHPDAISDLDEIWEFIAQRIWTPPIAFSRRFMTRFARSSPSRSKVTLVLT
jgi:hypothetical protein